MLQEQELAVRYAGRARPETAVKAHRVRFGLDLVLIFLPVHPVGRIGQHVVEFLVLVSIVAKRVAEGDLLRVMPRHQHVGFADAEGFAVQLLPEQLNADRGIEVLERAFRQGQHAARAAGWIIYLAYYPAPGEFGIVIGDQKINDQSDDLSRREMFTGGFVRDFREAADQFLKQITHLQITDGIGMKVDFAEPLKHVPENAAILQALQLVGEQELVEENVADIA